MTVPAHLRNVDFPPVTFCSFCGGSESKRKFLVQNGPVAICDLCVEQCALIAREREAKASGER